METERSNQEGLQASLADLRERFAAIVDELDRLDADVDVPRTIAEGGMEDVDRILGGTP